MILAKTSTEIRKELLAHIEAVQEEYIAKKWLPERLNLNNGVIRGLLEIFVFGIYQLYQFLDFVMRQATPKTATGEWLDMHAGGVDLIRKPHTKAKGLVEFIRSAAETGNVRIPLGKIVRTPEDAEGKRYRYITEAEVVLPKGQISVLVPIVAEEYGAKSNVTAGQIIELVTPIPGIASVANAGNWLTSEGADTENDSELLERYILQWRSRAGVTSAAYALAALSVTGVSAVKIFDQHPRGQGTVDVAVLGTGGVATAQLIEKVEKAIAAAIIINDNVLVKSVTPHPVSLNLTVRYTYGSAEELKAKATASITEKFREIQKKIGADVVLTRLISEVINMPGVDRVMWTTPAADVVIEADEVANLAGLEITMQETDL